MIKNTIIPVMRYPVGAQYIGLSGTGNLKGIKEILAKVNGINALNNAVYKNFTCAQEEVFKFVANNPNCVCKDIKINILPSGASETRANTVSKALQRLRASKRIYTSGKSGAYKYKIVKLKK